MWMVRHKQKDKKKDHRKKKQETRTNSNTKKTKKKKKKKKKERRRNKRKEEEKEEKVGLRITIFVDQLKWPKLFFQGAFRCQSCHKVQKKKNEKSIRPKCKKKKQTRKCNGVEKTKTHSWRIQMLAELSTGILWSSAVTWKDHQQSNAIVERGPFFLPPVAQKRDPSKLGNFLCFLWEMGLCWFATSAVEHRRLSMGREP